MVCYIFVLFLFHAFKFTNNKMFDKAKLFMDSESLIKQIEDMIEWLYFYASVTMSTDWDVLQAIVCIIKTFTPRPNLIHVKGHQDEKE